MNDVIKQDDLVTIDGETYFVIVTDDSTGINYGFVNQIDADDNATDIYKIIYKDGSDTKILVDEDKMVKLLPIFNKKVTELTNQFIKENPEYAGERS